MSAFDYSRFNSIGEGDSDDDESETSPANNSSSHNIAAQLNPTIASDKPPVIMTKNGKEGRYKYEYQGRTIYEWEQSLEEVNIYIEPPPGIPRNMYDIVIGHKHIKIGIKNAPPFIDEDTWGPVKSAESFWTLVDGELNINLQKMNKAETWEAALKGRGGQVIDDFTKEKEKKKMMLERFSEEHPGFDFSNAEFNGSVPNAQEFLGGVKRTF